MLLSKVEATENLGKKKQGNKNKKHISSLPFYPYCTYMQNSYFLIYIGIGIAPSES